MYSRLTAISCEPCRSPGRREHLGHLTALILSLLGLALSSCCHNRDLKDTTPPWMVMTPERHEKYMRESPLYRSFFEGPDYETSTQQFLERIKAKHHPEDLQDWAQKLLDLHAKEKESFTVPYKEVPSFILELDPPLEPVVIVFPRSHVAVDWGGGFGHWGLFLGMKEPLHNSLLYSIEWVPGVYAYHTNQ
jgi:hypothetical protein